jgi:hypothetical protein
MSERRQGRVPRALRLAVPHWVLIIPPIPVPDHQQNLRHLVVVIVVVADTITPAFVIRGADAVLLG